MSTSLPSLGPEPHDAPLLKGKSREAGQTTAAMSTSLPTSAPHLVVSTKDALNRVSTVYQVFALRWARLGASCLKHKEPVVDRGRHQDPTLVDTCLQSTNFLGVAGASKTHFKAVPFETALAGLRQGLVDNGGLCLPAQCLRVDIMSTV